jgi:hypothetical protein
MASDQAEDLVNLFLASAQPGGIDGKQLRAGNHASVQRLFASRPRNTLKERLPRRYPRSEIPSDSDAHNQKRLMLLPARSLIVEII